MTLKLKKYLKIARVYILNYNKFLGYLKILFCNEYLSDNDSERYLISAYFHTTFCPVVAKVLKYEIGGVIYVFMLCLIHY